MKRFDLRRLPSWLQYVISLTTIVLVGVLAWLVGHDKPIPYWVSVWVVPNLIWVFVGLIIIAAIGTVAVVVHRKRTGTGNNDQNKTEK